MVTDVITIPPKGQDGLGGSTAADAITITPERRDGTGGDFTIWVIRKDGDFIIGGQSEEAAKGRLAALEENGWSHLDCYECGFTNPIDWINHVRDKGWTFDHQSKIQVGKDGRAFFGGNINEYSAAFRYLILDKNLLGTIIKSVPEVPVQQ